MEWAMEKVLPREVQKLASAILKHLADVEDLTRKIEAIQIESGQQKQKHSNEILRFNA